MDQMSFNSCALAYQCELPFNHDVTSYRKTKIVCTIGPACNKLEILIEMIKSGMSIARLNFSHGTHDFHRGLIKLVREAAAANGEVIAIALDTKGPEIRTGRTIEDKTITIKKLQTLIVTTDDKFKESCTCDKLYLDYKFLTRDVKPGQVILLADGTGMLVVKEILNSTDVRCESQSEFSVGSKKNACFPGVVVDLPALAPKDIVDVNFAITEGVDIIFASFIRNKENVKELRDLLMTTESGKSIKIISKIENLEGVVKIDEIIEASDGIMVARGDLGMDLPLEKLPSAQKMIIARCNCASKPVICATQMMESMIKNERPTRAEVTDVHNAVLDGADGIMLSGETANGQNPPAVIDFMHRISQYAEASICRPSLHEDLRKCHVRRCRASSSCCSKSISTYSSIARSAADLALSVCASAIICFTLDGKSSRYISHARPHCPILMVTPSQQVARQGQLSCGLVPIHYVSSSKDSKWCTEMSEKIQFAIKYGIEKAIITKKCPKVVVTMLGEKNCSLEFTDGICVMEVDIDKKTATKLC